MENITLYEWCFCLSFCRYWEQIRTKRIPLECPGRRCLVCGDGSLGAVCREDTLLGSGRGRVRPRHSTRVALSTSISRLVEGFLHLPGTRDSSRRQMRSSYATDSLPTRGVSKFLMKIRIGSRCQQSHTSLDVHCPVK